MDDAKSLESLLSILNLGKLMRAAQVAYFKDRMPENLIRAKQLEEQFDLSIKGITQGSLDIGR